jgi:hypothetical protein
VSVDAFGAVLGRAQTLQGRPGEALMDTQRTTPMGLEEIRLAILRQHTQLAQLIDEVEAHANAVLTNAGEESAMRTALALLHTRFLRHLDYEEAHLTKWLPETETAPGAALLGDHDEQRLRIKGLLHDSEVFGDPRTLARETLAFVHHLRKDMTDEDAKLRALR